MVEEYANSAREVVLYRFSHGPVELSTIQTLSILSLVEFNRELQPTSESRLHANHIIRRQHSSSERV